MDSLRSLWNVSSAPQPSACPDRVLRIVAALAVACQTWPAHLSNLGFLLEGVDPGDAGPIYDLRVRNFVLPYDVEKSAKAAQVEMIELLGLSALDSPGLA